jgi:beta-N-acetylhexosaminidase
MSLGPLMVDVAGTSLTDEDRQLLRHPLVGSVILFTRNYQDIAQLRALVADIKALRSPQLLIAVDHEGGRVQRFRQGFSRLPAMRRIGEAFERDAATGLQMAQQLGWLMAAELRDVGIDFSFAPCVDLDYGASQIIGDRAFHARADVVGQLALATMQGMHDAGMAATAKHFPGHGAVVADSHLDLPVDPRTLTQLADDIAPYRPLVAAGLDAVMMAHVLFPAVDAVPASFSRRWVQQVLRTELGFAGVVFADDLSMQGAGSMGDVVVRAEAAAAAGCDVLPICNDRSAVIKVLQQWRYTASADTVARIGTLRGKSGCVPQDLAASASHHDALMWLERCNAGSV